MPTWHQGQLVADLLFKKTNAKKRECKMITAGDFRNGVTFEMEGKVYQVIEFQHVKPGKGAAFVRTKLRDIKNGGVVETIKIL